MPYCLGNRDGFSEQAGYGLSPVGNFSRKEFIMNANIKTIVMPAALLAVMVLAMPAQAQSYRTHVPRVGDYNVGHHLPRGAGAGGIGMEADKSVSTPSAPAGFGTGTVPNIGISSGGGTESRTPNSVMGDLGSGLTGDMGGGFGDLNITPSDLQQVPAGAGSRATGTAAGTGGLNPYGPAKTTPPVPFLNPYPDPAARINSVPVQYNAGTPAGVQKPFADYRAPDNFSPWMNLYRGGNRSGIDNYNFYVRPALEAQQQRDQTQRDMRNMQQQQNTATAQQQNQARYGASYGDLTRGPASYGFNGAGSASGTYSPATGSPVLAPQDDVPNKDQGTTLPTSVNPYAPLLDNSYDFDINPYAPVVY